MLSTSPASDEMEPSNPTASGTAVRVMPSITEGQTVELVEVDVGSQAGCDGCYYWPGGFTCNSGMEPIPCGPHTTFMTPTQYIAHRMTK